MSLEKYESVNPAPPREYIRKEFFPIPRCNNGDTITVIVNKDGIKYSDTTTVGPDEMIESHRLRFIIQDWIPEPEEVIP